MKRLLPVLMGFALLLSFSTKVWSLPPCPEKGVRNNCLGTYKSDDGSKYVGEWKDDQSHGQGTKTYANGDKYVGEFQNGKAKGKGAYTYANGDKTLGEFTEIIQPFLICDDPEKLFANGSIHLIYIDASNCSYCDLYKRIYLPNFKKQNLAKKIYFTIIETGDYRDTDRDEDWPEYLQWIRDKTTVHRGTPRFIVMSGRDIVANEGGTRRWNSRVIPLLKQLVGG